MPTANHDEMEDQKKPRRAAIYLSQPARGGRDKPRDELSVDEQAALCRYAATALGCEVVGEFTDIGADLTSRSGLHQALVTAEKERLDFLIISSPDRLADSCYDIVRVAWQLGRLGAIPLPAEVGFTPSRTEARSSRD